MKITDFNRTYIEEAMILAKANYEEERQFVNILPEIDTVPDLTPFADNGLGVAAFEDGKMVGFLCCVGPFDNAFRSTHAKGVFAPMEAIGTIPENRAKIYAGMYQYAAEKWIGKGVVSHSICLFSHDEIAKQQFFRYGFGLRCIDAIRPMEEIGLQLGTDFICMELDQTEFASVYPLYLMLNAHLRKSPAFMCFPKDKESSYIEKSIQQKARYFITKAGKEIGAFLKITDDAETFVSCDRSMMNITGAFCLPEYRGRGVVQNLLNFTISVLKGEGFTRLGVDFESINPTAYGFWLKYFTAYTHSVVRRIDERIIENISDR